jgi:hypothetical protein
MIVSCTMMRMLEGVWLRIRLTARLANAMTMTTATDITSALSRRVVTASAEQMPSTCTPIGLLSRTGVASALRSALPMKASDALTWRLPVGTA